VSFSVFARNAAPVSAGLSGCRKKKTVAAIGAIKQEGCRAPSPDPPSVERERELRSVGEQR
jgi:hypothetical protein